MSKAERSEDANRDADRDEPREFFASGAASSGIMQRKPHACDQEVLVRSRFLVFVCPFIVAAVPIVLPSWTAAADAPADGDLVKRLKRGRDSLRRGRTRQGVEELRGLLADHPDSTVAPPARDSLARKGFGLHSRVVLRDGRPILAHLKDHDLSHFVRRVEEIHSRLALFFRQTHSETHGQEFRLIVLDSPRLFRTEFPKARRRSAYTSLDPGWTTFPRGQVTVFWDPGMNPQDALDVLFENAAREMARTLLLRYTPRSRLPESFEVGLSEYLALRLFPQKLVGIDRTLEEIVQGLARDALGGRGLDKLAGFRSHFSGGPPETKLGPRAYGLWIAASYSQVDFLVNGIMPSRSDPKAGGSPPEEPRNAALQALLRGYERKEPKKGAKAPTRKDDAASFLERVEGHFHLDVPQFHKAWKAHIGRYPPKGVDFDLFSEF